MAIVDCNKKKAPNVYSNIENSRRRASEMIGYAIDQSSSRFQVFPLPAGLAWKAASLIEKETFWFYMRFAENGFSSCQISSSSSSSSSSSTPLSFSRFRGRVRGRGRGRLSKFDLAKNSWIFIRAFHKSRYRILDPGSWILMVWYSVSSIEYPESSIESQASAIEKLAQRKACSASLDI